MHSVCKECVTKSILTQSSEENLYVCKECIDIHKECVNEFLDSKAQEK
jgi:hypothetical protein